MVSRAQTQHSALRTPNKALPKIALLATGGTIAGTGSSSTQTAGYKGATVTAQTLINALPELTSIAHIEVEQVSQIESENMAPALWMKLGKSLQKWIERSDIRGVVVTHGTDTLEETAYFLNLVIPTHKPIVMVGAMRPSTAISADGPMNLFNAVVLANHDDAKNQGVLIIQNDQILGAREATKASTYGLDAFRSPEFGLLGHMHNGKVRIYRKAARRHTAQSAFDIRKIKSLPIVDIVYGYAGSRPLMMDAAVSGGAEGIVYAGTGNGSLSDEMREATQRARARGVIIVRSSRTANGPVIRNGEDNDDALGTLVSDTLNPQKARVLLMLGLTKTRDPEKLQQMFYEY